MSAWTPISKATLLDMINAAWERMTLPQRRMWKAVRISPVKWAERNYGNEGGGFWVVGICGQNVIWFNDIEDGFNRSGWSTPGRIDEYRCDQDQLEWTVQHVMNEIAEGQGSVK